MAAAAQLTPGAVAAIAEHANGTGTLQLVLEVVDVRLISVQNDPSAERFRLKLSDGVDTVQAMLAADENPRVQDGSIRNGTIIRLREFTCCTVQDRRIIVDLKLDVLQNQHDMVGNSVNEGMPAEIPWETVFEITNGFGYLLKSRTGNPGVRVPYYQKKRQTATACRREEGFN